MRRGTNVALFVGILVLGGFVAATDQAQSWSDGMAGSSGAVPEHLKKCTPPFKYCKVKTAGCGGCHGDFEAMQHQRESEQPVIDRMSGEIWMNGRPDTWQYEPGKKYVIDVRIEMSSRHVRPPGAYSHASFDLNVSAGKFELLPNDDLLRITGGNFSHAGSKAFNVCNPQTGECRPYGQTTDDERRWAGELTTTKKGSNITAADNVYRWRAVWVAPPRQEPRGAAFQMAFMISNSDGFDSSCTHVNCNTSLPYSDQDLWDWWSFIIPRKIVCEFGVAMKPCQDKVYAAIIPPPPPIKGQEDDDDGDGNGGGITPTLPVETLVALAFVTYFAFLRRRR